MNDLGPYIVIQILEAQGGGDECLETAKLWSLGTSKHAGFRAEQRFSKIRSLESETHELQIMIRRRIIRLIEITITII